MYSNKERLKISENPKLDLVGNPQPSLNQCSLGLLLISTWYSSALQFNLVLNYKEYGIKKRIKSGSSSTNLPFCWAPKINQFKGRSALSLLTSKVIDPCHVLTYWSTLGWKYLIVLVESIVHFYLLKSVYPIIFPFWLFIANFHNSYLTMKCLKFMNFIDRFWWT